MGYSNNQTNKPFERASKTAHTAILNDKAVQEFVNKCRIPISESNNTDIGDIKTFIKKTNKKQIQNIVAIDGGYTNVIIKPDFPSATMAFFQFGVLFFKNEDLINIEQKPFIDPSDMSKLQKIQRFKLIIPTKSIIYKNQLNLTDSIRQAIYEFFMKEIENNELMKTLKWFLFSEYGIKTDKWYLSSCPKCNHGVDIKREELKEFKLRCPHCRDDIYLTDVFRLHEAIDNELGAGGILGYTTTVIEQILIVYLIKIMLEIKPQMISETLFIKDGPLAFFGQTARMHKPMRNLIRYLDNKVDINFIGLEKNGSFVEHAALVSEKLNVREALILDNKYIYSYIIPGDPNSKDAYARTSYYGSKVIYKSQYNNIYVATLPTLEPLIKPRAIDLINLETCLNGVSELRCDLYYSSLVPIVLANKLVSLADHPSSDILKIFAKENVK